MNSITSWMGPGRNRRRPCSCFCPSPLSRSSSALRVETCKVEYVLEVEADSICRSFAWWWQMVIGKVASVVCCQPNSL